MIRLLIRTTTKIAITFLLSGSILARAEIVEYDFNFQSFGSGSLFYDDVVMDADPINLDFGAYGNLTTNFSASSTASILGTPPGPFVNSDNTFFPLKINGTTVNQLRLWSDGRFCIRNDGAGCDFQTDLANGTYNIAVPPPPVLFNYRGMCTDFCGSVGLVAGAEVTGSIVIDQAAALPGNVLADSDIVNFNFTFGGRQFGPPTYTIRLNDEVRVNATGNGLTGDATGIIKFLENDATFLGQIIANDLRWIAASIPTGSSSARGTGAFNPSDIGETPTGTNVEVTPVLVDAAGEPINESPSISIGYDSIITAGETTVEVVEPSEGPLPPEGFRLGDNGVYYDFNTDAEFLGPIRVCIGYDEANYADDSAITIQHNDGIEWVDVTAPGYPDTLNNVVCGDVPSFSYVNLFEALPKLSLLCQGFESPINNGAVSVKKNRVLPFKAQLIDGDSQPVSDLGEEPPVIQVLFNQGQADAMDVSDMAMPAGNGTDGNQFEFVDTYWQYNLKTKKYTASGTYTVTLISGNLANYEINQTCEGTFVIN